MFFAREVWCIANVSNVSPSSEQTRGLRLKRQPYRPNLSGEKHTTSTFVNNSIRLDTVFKIVYNY